jgi:peptidoglycan/xylan/chitin deacetylase (PgdA/CDA1 family)
MVATLARAWDALGTHVVANVATIAYSRDCIMQSNLISQCREWLLPAYYYGTLPARRLTSHLASLAGMQPIAVVYYHRVADTSPNPWTISNRQFARQIKWLTQNFDVLSLEQAQQRIRLRENHRPAVCITFDDGYEENCRQALPLLLAQGIPFTYFISSQFILRGEPFPHDVKLGVPLAPNSIQQVQSLAKVGVEIGAHTRTHCDLGRNCDLETLRSEILGSRSDVEEVIGRPVRYFAFPYGQYANLSHAAFQIARDAGFSGVCSAYGGYNLPGDDPFHLQRLHADPNFLRLKNWLTFDPRIFARVTRFEQGT